MPRYDPDKVHLGDVVESTRSPRPTPAAKLLVPLDSELAEAILMLSDYFPGHRKNTMIEQVLSILLLSLLQPDPDIHIDAMERVWSNHVAEDEDDSQKMWGEFMNIISTFRDVYENETALLEGLEELLPSDLRIFPEEIFQVKWSRGANYLLVE